MRKQQLATIPNTSTIDPCLVVGVKNQPNAGTNQIIAEDQINHPATHPQVYIQNNLISNVKATRFAKHFLLYESWILTNRCITSNMRHHSALKNAVLQQLINQDFLREIKGGLRSSNPRTIPIDIWVKCMPSCKDDFTVIQE